jgi:hypothetical protein
MQMQYINHLTGIAIIFLYYFILSKKFYYNGNTKFFILYIIVNLFTFIFIAKQLTPRYFIDIYFVIGLLLIYSFNNLINSNIFKFLYNLIKIQAFFVMISAFFVILFFLPGSLSPNSYNKMMLKTADGYAESVWVDEVLPKNAIYISENSRSHSLYPRNFISIRQLLDNDEYDIINLIRAENINYAVLSVKSNSIVIRKILQNCRYDIVDKKNINKGLRNPFTSLKSTYNLMIIKLKC